MKHKNIAVLMTAIDSLTQAEVLRGIEKVAKENGYNVATFVWFAGAYEKEDFNVGELNIINLPDFNLFDGVIAYSNVLHIEESRNKIIPLLRSLTCPVLFIGEKIDDFLCINFDSYSAMRELMEYFVKEEGKTRIHFVKGVKDNVDAEARYKAYVDVLTENGITVNPERVTQGDFYIWGGELATKEILASELPFPEVIVCANDIMAVTVCTIMKEKGYRVPEDIMITGYDYSPEGQDCVPKLTTVRSRFKEAGIKACEMILDTLAGKEIEKDFFLADEVIYTESTGHQYHEAYYLDSNVNKDLFQRKMIHRIIEFEKGVMISDGYDDWLNVLKEFVAKTDPKEFYCCVNDDFHYSVFEQDIIDQDSMTREEKLAYTSMTKVALQYKNGVFKEKANFETRYALDNLFLDTELPKSYIFSPLHYLDRNYGYLIFVDSDFPIANQFYISWLINMSDSIENMRKQNLLKNAMKRLDDMYIRDSLTGACNRFGMERFFGEIKQKSVLSNVSMQLSFLDVDNLKTINDRYGHDEGDRIISAVADILQKHAGKFCVVRYGGDEFIVLGTVHSEKEIVDYWAKVDEDVKVYNECHKRNADLSISYGYDVFRLQLKTNLADCISIADNKMYKAKADKKEAWKEKNKCKNANAKEA